MPAPPAAGAAPAAGLAAPGLAFSTSDLTIRPRGPVPASAEISIPLEAAIRLASGEAKTRLPSPAGLAAGAAAGAAAAGLAAADTAAPMSFMAAGISALGQQR